jgi:hypothetical protein
VNNGGQGKGNGPELKLAIIGSIAIGITGFATLFWLAIEDPTRRDSLSDAADWLLKVGIGTFIGVMVGRRAR